MRSVRGLILLVAVGFFCGLGVRGQEAGKGSEADSAAIKQAIAAYDESFGKHDAAATAACFSTDADFTNMYGIHKQGHKDIEERFATLFSTTLKTAGRVDIVRSIRFLTPGLAAVDAETVITGSRTADGSPLPERKGLLIAVMAKQNGRWVISVFHEAEYPPPPAAAPAKS